MEVAGQHYKPAALLAEKNRTGGWADGRAGLEDLENGLLVC
jgi:hypothetical protein